MDIFDFFPNGAGNCPAIFADQHEHRAHYHFASVLCGGARAKLAAQAYLGHVAHSNGYTTRFANNNCSNLINSIGLTRHPHEPLLPIVLYKTRTPIAIVVL